MPPVINHFAASGKVWKVLPGPAMGPSAGPTFATDVAAHESAVKKSNPKSPSAKARIVNVKNHMKKKLRTETITSSEIGRRL